MKALLPVFLLLLSAATLRAQDIVAPAPLTVKEAEKNHLLGKLHEIILPRIEFREATVAEALEFFQKKIDGLGTLDAASAPEKIALTYRNGIRIAAVDQPKVTLSLKNIPLFDALHYFSLIARLKTAVGPGSIEFIALQPGWGVPGNDPLDPNLDAGDTDAITAKLNTIVIPKFEVRGATVPEALDFLRAKCAGLDTAEKDPANKGFNIVLAAVPKETKLTFSIAQTPVLDVLRLIAKQAGLQLDIDPHAAVLVPAEGK